MAIAFRTLVHHHQNIPRMLPNKRLDGLDALRAIAVMLTFAMHFSWLYANRYYAVDLETTRATPAMSLELLLQHISYYSLYGVYLFFMISGLLIARKTHQLVLSCSNSPSKQAVWRLTTGFYRDRALRIFPAFWAALAGSYAVLMIRGDSPPHGLTDILLNMSLVNWFAPEQSPPWLIVSWSLQIEWLFYIAMPVIAFSAARVNARLKLAALVLGTLALTVTLKALGGRAFAYPICFAIGIASAWYLPAAYRVAQASPNTLWMFAALLLLQVGYSVLEPIGAEKPPFTFTVFDAFMMLFALIGGALFVTTAYGSTVWASNNVLLWLGRRSYSFYLWHLPILVLCFHAIHKTPIADTLAGWPWQLRFVVMLSTTLALSFAIAAVSYEIFEAKYLSLHRRKPAQ